MIFRHCILIIRFYCQIYFGTCNHRFDFSLFFSCTHEFVNDPQNDSMMYLWSLHSLHDYSVSFQCYFVEPRYLVWFWSASSSNPIGRTSLEYFENSNAKLIWMWKKHSIHFCYSSVIAGGGGFYQKFQKIMTKSIEKKHMYF